MVTILASHRAHRRQQPRNPTIASQDENGELIQASSTSLFGTITSQQHERRDRRCKWLLSTRNAAVALLFLCLFVASLIFSKNEVQYLHLTPPYVTKHESSAANLPEAAWMELLERYRLIESVRKPKFEWTWMPTVIRGNKLFLAQQHATELANDNRYQLFSTMVGRALKLAAAHRNSKRESALTINQGDDIPLLHKRMKKLPIPLVAGLGDFKTCRGQTFPRFSWCTVIDAAKCHNFALPSFSVYRDAPDAIQDYTSFHQKKEKSYPWAGKKQQAVWRGSASGGNPKGWMALPRAQLVNFSIHNPELLDAALTEANEYKVLYPEDAQKLFNHSRFGHWIGFPDFQKYRAILDIDGNAWSDRFGNLLCMNSVVIKVQPANMNYFFDELKPWVHYIPVASNMSDMVQALQFAVSNDTESKVRSIVYRANEWCRMRVTKARFDSDVFWMLNNYVRLLGRNETRWGQWQKVFKAFKRNMTLVGPGFC